MKKIAFFWLFFLFANLLNAKSPSPNIYYIKLGEFANENEAKTHISSLEINLSPIELVHEKDLWKVCYGEFPFYMDADLYLQDLQEWGMSNVRIEKKVNIEEKTKFNRNNGPNSKIFNMVEGEDSLTPCLLNMNDPDIEQINNLIRDGTTEEIRNAVMNKIQTCPNEDPKKGWLTMRLAYLKLREKDKATAQQIFHEIAEGKMKASPEVRIKAMIKVSYLIHAKKERTKAYRAFKEIYQIAEDPGQKAEALLQLSGLLMEQARCEKGTLAEARVFMENALEEIPETLVEIRATIDQMHMEAWYYEDSYNECIVEGEELLERYQNFPLKIIATCRLFLGHAYANKNNYEDAVGNLSEILLLPLGPKDKWKAIPDLKKHALIWLITISERFDQTNDAEEWKKTMKLMYPEE